MKLILSKRFKKNVSKFSKKIQDKAYLSLFKFKNNNLDKSLNLHNLKWKFNWLKSINVSWDIRILLNPITGEIIEIVDIWTHSEIY